MGEADDPTGALIDGLAMAGLVQFGQFRREDGAVWPVWVNLRMAASYPALLRDLAAAMVPLVGGAEDVRLLCTAEAIPLAVAISLETGLPLVWPYGADRAHTPAFVYEGAYDVGHPTVLVTDVLIDEPQARDIVATAGRVGLVVRRIAAALDLELGARVSLARAGFEVGAVLRLGEMLPRLAASGWLPAQMYTTVAEWMKEETDER